MPSSLRCFPVAALVSLAACGSSAGGGYDGGTEGGSGGSAGKAGSAGSGGSAGGGSHADGGGACGVVAACGGVVVGTWVITGSCVTADLNLSSVCAGVTAAVVFSFGGSATYNADFTYTQTSSSGGTVHYHFPQSCIGTKTCAQVQTNLLAPSSQISGGMALLAATCDSAAGGCDCDAVLTPSPANETGTYTTANSILTTVHDGTSDQAPYCVSGITMHQMAPAGAPEAGSITLTKQ